MAFSRSSLRKMSIFTRPRHLPTDDKLRAEYLSVVDHGFEELREFLFDQEVWS